MMTNGEMSHMAIVQSSLRTIAEELKRANDLKALEIQCHTCGVMGLQGRLKRIMGDRYVPDDKRVEDMP